MFVEQTFQCECWFSYFLRHYKFSRIYVNVISKAFFSSLPVLFNLWLLFFVWKERPAWLSTEWLPGQGKGPNAWCVYSKSPSLPSSQPLVRPHYLEQCLSFIHSAFLEGLLCGNHCSSYWACSRGKKSLTASKAVQDDLTGFSFRSPLLPKMFVHL